MVSKLPLIAIELKLMANEGNPIEHISVVIKQQMREGAFQGCPLPNHRLTVTCFHSSTNPHLLRLTSGSVLAPTAPLVGSILSVLSGELADLSHSIGKDNKSGSTNEYLLPCPVITGHLCFPVEFHEKIWNSVFI